jgi:hypothetical protein
MSHAMAKIFLDRLSRIVERATSGRIAPLADDGFRMFFFRDELPKFASYRVHVEEVGAARGPAR